MDYQKVVITIPEEVRFEDLELSRDPDGMVSFSWKPIEKVCRASNLDASILKESTEDNVSGLLVAWYQQHRDNGGGLDSVAEDLIFEVAAENKLGGGLSHHPGKA